MKKMTSVSTAFVAATFLWTAAALGQAQPVPTPQRIEGQVVKIDHQSGRVTIKDNAGTIHEFTASPETLKDLKEGDRITAQLRK
jgi:hypothetical protein